MRWLVRVILWMSLKGIDRDIFWAACNLAIEQISDQDETGYYGGTKHAIAYERVRTILAKNGYDKAHITGAVVHLAIALKYLQSS